MTRRSAKIGALLLVLLVSNLVISSDEFVEKHCSKFYQSKAKLVFFSVKKSKTNVAYGGVLNNFEDNILPNDTTTRQIVEVRVQVIWKSVPVHSAETKVICLLVSQGVHCVHCSLPSASRRRDLHRAFHKKLQTGVLCLQE